MSRCLLLIAVLLGATAAAAVPMANEANRAQTLTVEKVVLFSRHGIRTPYGAQDMGQKTMTGFSTNAGANWLDNTTSGGANLTAWGADVDQGLTTHGAAVLSRMGQYYANEFVEGLGGNTTTITVYADFEASRRDIHTAEAFLSGLLGPRAGDVTINAPADLTKWLFNQGHDPIAPGCTLPSQTIVDGTLGGDVGKYEAAQRDFVMGVNAALGCCRPSVCGNVSACTLMELETSWNPKAFWSLYSGPLAVASNLAEWIQLMYLNNLDVAGLLGPDVDMSEVSALTRVHQINVDITDDNLWTARSFGSYLMAHLVATIEQLFFGNAAGPTLVPGVLSRPEDKLVYYAGHDLNIYFLRAMLGLKWTTESFNPNQSPPGGMLRFELLRDADKNSFVKLYFESQSYTQQRSASALDSATNAPDRSFVAIPKCAGGPFGACPWPEFKALALAALDPGCLVPKPSAT